MTPLTLVVMAAGIGSRYGGLKQIEPVGPHGEILLDYAIFDARRAGFQQFLFVIRRDIEAAFRERLEAQWDRASCFDFVHQELSDVPPGFSVPAGRAKPWGTGHAVHACRNKVLTRFGVINADDFYGAASFRLLAEKLSGIPDDASDAVLVGFLLRNTLSEHGPVARGVCETDQAGLLRKIVEHPRVERQEGRILMTDGNGRVHQATGNEVVSMNLCGFTPRWFGYFENDFHEFLRHYANDPKAEFMLPAVVDGVIQRRTGVVQTAVSPERWMGVTYPGDRAAVAAGIADLVRCGAYPQRLSGVLR